MNKLNLFFGFENHDKRRGQIYLNNVHFANFYTMADDGPGYEKHNNKLALNRSSKEAFEITNPAPFFDSVEEMEAWINKQFN